MTDALELAEVLEGEGQVALTLSKKNYVIVDGDIRLYLARVSGNDEVTLSIIAPKEVTITRSDSKMAREVFDH